jgi:hypothetical protein
MIRNLKALGLAVVAVFAMSALVASAAQALVTTKTEITPKDSKATEITGKQEAGHEKTEFTLAGRAYICGEAHFKSEISGNTTHALVTPKYENCESTPVLGVTFKVEITINKCWYTFTGENTVVTGKYGVSVHLECQNAGEEIVFHVKSAGSEICTLTIKPQTVTGPYVENVAGTPDSIKLNWNTANFQGTVHGQLCGGINSETNKEFTGEYHGVTTLKGFQGGNQVNLTVSHTEVIE